MIRSNMNYDEDNKDYQIIRLSIIQQPQLLDESIKYPGQSMPKVFTLTAMSLLVKICQFLSYLCTKLFKEKCVDI